ncbi:MAG: ATP-binding cassette domain-containing protein [Dehalococcoidia bacterium]|nr:ATP-binding cassette domain-containing protein [Dehalococcoidia bacterium]
MERLLAEFGLNGVADRPAGSLPLGTGRLVEVTRALATRPRVLLLDEPSSGLDQEGTDALAGEIPRLRDERGIALVLVEHNLDLVLRLADEGYVLDFGEVIARGTPEEVRADPAVQAAYMGNPAEPSPPAVATAAGSPERAQDNRLPLLRIEGLDVRYGAVAALFELSLDVREGTAVAVLGANGAGKTTTARAIAGLVPRRKGRITFDGHDIMRWPAHRIARLGVGVVPEARGIFPRLSVADNLRLGTRLASNQTAAVERAFALLPALANRKSQVAGTLSGGEQQMLALARVLATSPRLIGDDEPSLGLAPRLVEAIFEALAAARNAGTTVILIEQFADRGLRFADEAIVLRQAGWPGAGLPTVPRRSYFVTTSASQFSHLHSARGQAWGRKDSEMLLRLLRSSRNERREPVARHGSERLG